MSSREIICLGWVRFRNDRQKPLHVVIEPWGVGPDPLPPGQTYDVYIASAWAAGAPQIDMSDDFLTIWADQSVVAQNGKVLFSLSDLDPLPEPSAE